MSQKSRSSSDGASSSAAEATSSQCLPAGARRGPQPGDQLIHEGWCVKESGTKFCGRYQWQKRWFRLVTDRHNVSRLSYFKACTDNPAQMAGSVQLDQTYCTRPVEKQHGKAQPFCFAVGPLVEDGIKRCYYISCESEQIRQEWMEVLDAAIEGVPEEAKERRATVSHRLTSERSAGATSSSDLKNSTMYTEPKARIQEWAKLHEVANNQGIWKKTDTKSGITVSRAAFADRSSCDLIKLEGTVSAPLDLMFNFLQQASQPGGKLDYPFRQEEVLEEITDEPSGHVFYNEYNVPWPRISARDICCACSWVPYHMTPPELKPSCGAVFYSVEHAAKPHRSDTYRVRLDTSGVILRHHPTETGEVITHMTAIIQINTQTALQRMLRGAYRSGLLKLGLRAGFEHIVEQVENYQSIINQ